MPTDPADIEKLKEEMRATKALIDVVRRTARDESVAAGAKVGIVDGRVADEARHEYEDEEVEGEAGIDAEEGTRVLDRDQLLASAKRTRRGYFVVEGRSVGADEKN